MNNSIKIAQQGFVEITGSNIYYEIEGKGEPIVFIHADALDSRMWDNQYNYFKKNHMVIRYDIRGFGKSDIPSKEAYSFEEDLHILLHHLSIAKVHLVGLSLGGAIAIDFALLYPEKVYSLVLADSGIAGNGFSKAFLAKVNKVIALAKNNKLNEAKAAWLNLELFSYSKKLPQMWNNIKQMVLETSGYRWYGNNQPLEINPLAADRLEQIEAPTLILIGEYDSIDFQKKVLVLNQQIKNNRVVQIVNAGHLSNMDNPVQFNKEIQIFLETLHYK